MKNTSLPSFSQLLNLAIERVKPIYWKLVGINIIALIVTSPVSFYYFYETKRLNDPTNLSGSHFLVMFMLLSIFTIFFSLWMKLAQRYLIIKREGNLAATYLKTLKFVLPLLYIYFLCYLVLLPAALLLIPILIVIVRFWFVDWLLITDGDRGLTTLMKSRNLSKGIFFKVLWRISLPWILLFSVIIFFSIGINEYVADVQNLIVSFSTSVIEMLFLPVMMQYDYELFSILRKRSQKSLPKTALRYKIVMGIGIIFLLIALVPLVLSFLYPELFIIPVSPINGGITPHS